MSCPECQNGEIDSSGTCLNCGYKIPAESGTAESTEADRVGRSVAGAIEVDYSEGDPETPSPNDVPQWRKELSERLQAIKKKREAEGPRSMRSETAWRSETAPRREPEISAPHPAPKAHEDPVATALRAEIIEKMKARKPVPKPQSPPPLQKTLQPLETPLPAARALSDAADPQKIQNLIDSMVSRQADPPIQPIHGMEATIPVIEEFRANADRLDDGEGKLILLSRTLSGLVDLIFTVLCAGLFILATDYVSGIVVLDSVSLIYLSLLFLLTYFGYSLFFLASSNQTIGMMITDLRVVGVDGLRPTLRQLLTRCCGYLVSLFGLGIGLLWSLCNRENLCLHDRISGTRVVRL